MSMFRFPLASLIAASVLVLTSAAANAASDDSYREGREQFRAAYEQVDAQAAAPRRADSEALRAYPLYPYLQAARIRRTIADATSSDAVDQRAATFLSLHERDAVGRDLRRVWLASLAERGRWDTFLDYYKDDVADDALRCQSFLARIATTRTSDLAPAVAKQWLTPRSLQPCEQPFAWLRGQSVFTPELIEQRVRLALKDNNPVFARQIAIDLPPERAQPLLQWAALLESPQRSIDGLIASSQTPVDNDALLAGWMRLARMDRDAAIQRLDALIHARDFDGPTAERYIAALALPLAWDRRPEALQYFKRLTKPDDATLEWQARAALWSGDWQYAAQSIAAMSESQRKLARWRYWAGRAAEQANDDTLAKQLYESVLLDDNYYSIMAANRLERAVEPHLEKLPLDKVQMARVQNLPQMVRARELVQCAMYREAQIEWQDGFSELSESARRQAVHLASEWGWYEQSILTAAQQRLFNDYELLYPRPFDREVAAAARQSQVPSELIYAVLRQESLYRVDAVSGAGARGLLQLMPETAHRTARSIQHPKPHADDLFDPAINVPLGAAQLRQMIDRFGGQRSVALAGYNAGPNAVARWLPGEAMDPDIWIENIPFNETRTYVQRVLWHSVVFNWLKSGEPQKTDGLLARVVPLNDPTVLGLR
jgi:soluble lytic murein transglycosylase